MGFDEAYENSVEVVASDLSDGGSYSRIEKEKSWLIKKHKYNTQLFTVSSLIIQNPFEFPRQQSDKSTKPEVSEFKASQRLLNPKSES
uniref:Uncharacterized protein n=1 Tax=Panagrolaimus sp. PS1159 TaxID=55785 RepID=A0AC35EYA0_9BILA